MKLLPVLFLALISLLFSCSDKSDTAETLAIEEGEVNKRVYENESLGWSIPIPKDWVVKPAPSEQAAPGANKKALALKQVKRLLFTCREEFNCNGSMVVVVQPATEARGGTDPEKVYEYMTKQEEENNRSLQIKAHYTKDTKEFGGKEFNALTIKRQNKNQQIQKLEQMFLFRFIGDKMVFITLNYEGEQQKELLLNAMNNAEFEK